MCPHSQLHSDNPSKKKKYQTRKQYLRDWNLSKESRNPKMTTSFLISTPSRWGLTELSHSWILYRVTAALVLRNGSATAVAPDFQGDTAPLCSLVLRPHYLQHSTHSCHYYFFLWEIQLVSKNQSLLFTVIHAGVQTHPCLQTVQWHLELYL